MGDAQGSFSVDGHAPADGVQRVVVVGDLDIASSPMLQDRVEELSVPHSTLVLDLGEVTFLDSTGLRALWSLRQNVAGTGGRFLLASPSEAVNRVLQLTKLEKVFDYARDEEKKN
jgi:anti-sigma B factor antagonist